MKVVIITIIILVLFFSGALYFNHYVQFHTDKLITAIDQLDEVIMAGDWETGKEKLAKVNEDWNEIKRVFETLLEHYDLDAIEISLSKIEKFIEIEDQSLALGEITELRFIIKLIQKKESLTLSNLL